MAPAAQLISITLLKLFWKAATINLPKWVGSSCYIGTAAAFQLNDITGGSQFVNLSGMVQFNQSLKSIFIQN